MRLKLNRVTLADILETVDVEERIHVKGERCLVKFFLKENVQGSANSKASKSKSITHFSFPILFSVGILV